MTRTFYKKLGNKIYKLRREKKLSREKFAELAGINDYYLGEIERGEKRHLWICYLKYHLY